jgi:pimeloyl-ACP methyl ester carboxylesterase
VKFAASSSGQSAIAQRRALRDGPIERQKCQEIQMPFFDNGDVRIHFQEAGTGFPLLLIAGGGLNSNLSAWTSPYGPFDAVDEFKDHFRCITMDQRNAHGGQSTGPLGTGNPWDTYADDQLGLMSYLGCEQFLVLGCCIGGPFLWNLLQRAPERIVAAVMCQPSGYSRDHPTIFYDNNVKNWGPPLCERNPEITMDMVREFLDAMYTSRPDFVFTVTRDFVRACTKPVLIMPDDVAPHPYEVAMESANLAPNSEVTLFPWKDTKEHLSEAVRHVRRFLMAHEPLAAE